VEPSRDAGELALEAADDRMGAAGRRHPRWGWRRSAYLYGLRHLLAGGAPAAIGGL